MTAGGRIRVTGLSDEYFKPSVNDVESSAKWKGCKAVLRPKVNVMHRPYFGGVAGRLLLLVEVLLHFQGWLRKTVIWRPELCGDMCCKAGYMTFYLLPRLQDLFRFLRPV